MPQKVPKQVFGPLLVRKLVSKILLKSPNLVTLQKSKRSKWKKVGGRERKKFFSFCAKMRTKWPILSRQQTVEKASAGEDDPTKLLLGCAADIAQWIRLRLPFCHPGFESQAHHLRFIIYSHIFHLCFICRCICEKNENKHF